MAPSSVVILFKSRFRHLLLHKLMGLRLGGRCVDLLLGAEEPARI
jgi:hypothetical protein